LLPHEKGEKRKTGGGAGVRGGKFGGGGKGGEEKGIIRGPRLNPASEEKKERRNQHFFLDYPTAGEGRSELGKGKGGKGQHFAIYFLPGGRKEGKEGPPSRFSTEGKRTS